MATATDQQAQDDAPELVQTNSTDSDASVDNEATLAPAPAKENGFVGVMLVTHWGSVASACETCGTPDTSMEHDPFDEAYCREHGLDVSKLHNHPRQAGHVNNTLYAPSTGDLILQGMFDKQHTVMIDGKPWHFATKGFRYDSQATWGLFHHSKEWVPWSIYGARVVHAFFLEEIEKLKQHPNFGPHVNMMDGRVTKILTKAIGSKFSTDVDSYYKLFAWAIVRAPKNRPATDSKNKAASLVKTLHDTAVVIEGCACTTKKRLVDINAEMKKDQLDIEALKEEQSHLANEVKDQKKQLATHDKKLIEHDETLAEYGRKLACLGEMLELLRVAESEDN